MSAHRRRSLVEQVREGLVAELSAAGMLPGAKLPNESQLAARFMVSRSTIREAVGGLIDAGYVTRVHGSGTFVRALPASPHPLEMTVSYTQLIRSAGYQPSERILSKELREPSPAERHLLALADGEQVIEVERVRLADHRPVIYSKDRIPTMLLEHPADQPLDSSLYTILNNAGHPVASASARLTPTTANTRLAKLLNLKRGTPLLHIDQIDYDQRGHSVMLSAEWHVADAFELIINRRATPTPEDH
jgi:GntR family transcriptional regulator